MSARQRFFERLHRSPPARVEAALWMAAEHEKAVDPDALLQEFKDSATAGQLRLADAAGQ